MTTIQKDLNLILRDTVDISEVTDRQLMETKKAIEFTDFIFHEAFLRINNQHDGAFYDEVNRKVLPQPQRN